MPKIGEHWLKRFLAKSKPRGYKDVLLRIEEVKKDGSYYQDIKIYNNLAHDKLLISHESDLCFGIIKNSKSERFSVGHATLVWLNLIKKFEARTKMNVIKLKKVFMECGLENFNKDPDKWLINLENIKWKLKGMGHKNS